MTNAPHDGWAYLFVDAADPVCVMQRWVGTAAADVYVRMRNNNVWTQWNKVTN
ncbi:hypothetical protein FC50_GL001819 [Lacticaseibacillus pantheris DSM 15945 = JCM 12539 = NBRC 106106]|uniref:Uncharacterized protein n=2 Tax=Lacticaseibacillus pantheris TaxID=171523 RepID=A0A0R1TVQ4_9LACO|nr:hypothetical protein FC50_GL001819 [Lacticaseibacillus pantheris DSM 15945 = JCM 12539 = NBRC 106106]